MVLPGVVLLVEKGDWVLSSGEDSVVCACAAAAVVVSCASGQVGKSVLVVVPLRLCRPRPAG
jgi:hypothetical protein